MTKINLFADFFSKSPIDSSIEAVYQQILSDDKLKVMTESYRLTGNDSFKQGCPAFSVACLFKDGKAQRHVVGFTGFSLADLDHIIPGKGPLTPEEKEKLDQVKAKACADPHTLLCYITASGRGLRIIFRYELSQALTLDALKKYYPHAFAIGNAYYAKLLDGMLSESPDEKCKNYTRLSGIAYDPEAYFRPDTEPFTITEIYNGKEAHTAKRQKETQLQRIQSYYDGIIVPKLQEENIFYKPGHHNEYVMRTGYLLSKKRYKLKTVLEWATKTFADYADTEKVIRSCFDKRKPESDKLPWASVDDIKLYLESHVKLRFNEITQRPEYLSKKEGWLNINDRIVNSLWSEMSVAARINVQDLFRVINSDYVPLFNPFKEYFKRLPEWHEGDQDHIADLAATVKVKGEPTAEKPEGSSRFTFRSTLKKWLVAMVASWLSDDVVNNVILVLIGEQGAFKTTWFNYLLPPELKQYFYTKTNANRMSKDDLLTLAMYALVCCEELDTMRPAELNQLKAAVTMPSIDERAAYAHYHEHRKHIASFCGTGNNTQFLSDPTGNRRWLPFEVESIVSPREHPFNYEGIYAQALALYKSGFQYWFTKEEIQNLNHHNKQFETPRLEHELVDLYFRKPVGAELGEFMSVARALQIISNGISQKLSAVNVGRAFSDLGFKRVRTNHCRGFIVVCRTAEEIKAYQHRLLVDAQCDR